MDVASQTNEVNVADFITPAEAAAYHGVTLATIYKAVTAGRIETRRVLGRRALLRASVVAFAPKSDRRRTAAPPVGFSREGISG